MVFASVLLSIMRRRDVLGAAGVSTVAALAGCVGGIGGADGDSTNRSDSAFDGATVLESHRAGLEAAGTFTIEYSRTTEKHDRANPEPLTETKRTQWDLTTDRLIEHSSDSLGVSSQETYVEGDVYYWQGESVLAGPGGGTGERTEDQQFEFSVRWLGGSLREADDRSRFTTRGTEQFDGVTVTRLEAEGADVERGPYNDIRYVILVDEAGIVRYHERFDDFGEPGTEGARLMTQRWHVSDVGTTVVDEPDWVADFR
jgi:hypothetical protein